MPIPPHIVMETAVHILGGTWVEVQCCSGTTFLPTRMLARQHGGDWRLGAIVERLRCKQCGGRPAEVALTERADGGYPGGGGPPGWRVPLAP